MRFKVGDKVEITRKRDVNVGSFSGPNVGKPGIITRMPKDWRALSWYGPIEVVEPGSTGAHYCKEEDIKHVDGPETPHDKKLQLPQDKWMKRRLWRDDTRAGQIK
jgi:hypothetical protein